MRTHLSALPIDLHLYLEEKRRGLELWAHRLQGILEPPPEGDNIVSLRVAR